MKTKEELNTLKNEVETVGKKLAELNEEELEQVAGGIPVIPIAAMAIWKDSPFKPGQIGPTNDD